MVWLLAERIAIMFGFMAIGWMLFKKKFLTEQGAKDLSQILLRLVVPAIIIESFLIERTPENTRAFLLSFVLALAAIVLSALVARIVFRNKRVADQFGTAFSNAGFFGIPLVSALLGEAAVFYIASFVMMIFVFQWTYGVHLYTKDKTIFSPKKIFTNPVLIAFVIAVVLFFAEIELPMVITAPLALITPLNTPIAMFIIGSYLARSRFVDLFTDKSAYLVVALRLVVIPLLTIGLLSLLPASMNEVRFAILIPAAAPVGVNVAIFAGLLNQDYSKAVRIVCLSTLLSILTMPLIVMLATAFW
ncbi:MAG: AEC family transporter [Bacillota bacterium]|nr:AEC family transporter [Bacillota bacterium]